MNALTPPSKPVTKVAPEGTYSTIRFPDGTIETILFDDAGYAIFMERSYLPIAQTQRAHIEAIQAKLAQAKEEKAE